MVYKTHGVIFCQKGDGKMSGGYRGRDYARNKYSEGIVYQFADGSKIEITM